MPNKNGRKRKICESDEFNELKAKLKRLERKMLRGRRRRIVSSSSDSASSCSPTSRSSSRSRSKSPAQEGAHSDVQADLDAPSTSSRIVVTQAQVHEPPAAEFNNLPDQPVPSVDPTNVAEAPTTPDIQAELDLNEDILQILGEDPSITKAFGKNIQKDLAIRFEHIAINGLSKEVRKELKEKYLVPANCTLIDAPQVNPEVQAAISEAASKRLKGMEQKQKQLASAISCLGEAITLVLSQKETDSNLLKLLMDVGRIICDTQYSDSLTRRYFILASLKKDMKEQLLLTKIDKFLFGNNLADTLKSAKAIHKSGAELKQTYAFTKQPAKKPNNKSKTPYNKNSNLNSKPPPSSRRSTGRTRLPEPAPKNQPVSSSRNYRQSHRSNRR